MKKINAVVLLALILATPLISLAKPELTIKFSECFLKYNTMNGATEIILYDIRPSRETKMTKALFKAAFGLTEFEIKEIMFSEPGSATSAIRVLAQAKNFMLNAPVQQLFSNLLDTKAEVDLQMSFPSQMKMNVLLPMQKNLYVADSNALGVLENEEKTKFLIEFDISKDPLEVVIGWKQEETLAEKMDREYQHDADIFRLRHLEYFGGLIEEYHQKTGKYPLQGNSEYQNYVYIAAPHQQKYANEGPPYKHDVTDVESFRKELEKGLGRRIDFKFDPQKVPVHAPNFYIYMIEGDRYFFAVHLYNKFPFSTPVGKHYNKLEITNEEPNRHGLWRLNELVADAGFKMALNKTPHKNGWFLHLEEKYK